MAIIGKTRNNKCWQECREKRTLCTVDRNVNCSYCGKLHTGSLKKSKIAILYDSVIPLMSIYLKGTEILTGKDRCSSVFFAVLFTIAKTWK